MILYVDRDGNLRDKLPKVVSNDKPDCGCQNKKQSSHDK